MRHLVLLPVALLFFFASVDADRSTPFYDDELSFLPAPPTTQPPTTVRVLPHHPPPSSPQPPPRLEAIVPETTEETIETAAPTPHHPPAASLSPPSSRLSSFAKL